MNNELYASRVKEIFSNGVAKNYPKKAVGERYEFYAQNISYGCSLGRKHVLELCCGTGKYFHFLDRSISNLTCVDISEAMLKEAKENAKNYPNISMHFINENIEKFHPIGYFDFVYCIGSLGEYCPFNLDILDNILSYTAKGGFIFITIVDSKWGYTPRTGEYDWSELFMSKLELATILDLRRKQIDFRMMQHTDNKHTHHILCIWKL